MNTAEFIDKATSVHGGRYTYHKSVYHYRKPIVVTCPHHGDFTVRCDHHIGPRKGGCKKCYREKLLLDGEDVLKKLKEKHQNVYDYPDFKYSGMRSKIKILCTKHGEFEQSVFNHMNGQKCPRCNHEQQSLSTLDFIAKAEKIHGGKYDYSKVEYKDTRTYITITCKEHGDFEKVPSNHLHKTHPQGCPKCVEYSGFQNSLPAFLYLFKSKDENFCKIGISNVPKRRIKRLKKATPFDFEIVKVKKLAIGTVARKWERIFHKNFKNSGLHGFDGCTEWFMWEKDVEKWFEWVN